MKLFEIKFTKKKFSDQAAWQRWVRVHVDPLSRKKIEFLFQKKGGDTVKGIRNVPRDTHLAILNGKVVSIFLASGEAQFSEIGLQRILGR